MTRLTRRRRARSEPGDGNGGWLRPKEMGLIKGETSKETEAAHFHSKMELMSS
jgi:hypothetical protein